jgi:hypothetical protein
MVRKRVYFLSSLFENPLFKGGVLKREIVSILVLLGVFMPLALVNQIPLQAWVLHPCICAMTHLGRVRFASLEGECLWKFEKRTLRSVTFLPGVYHPAVRFGEKNFFCINYTPFSPFFQRLVAFASPSFGDWGGRYCRFLSNTVVSPHSVIARSEATWQSPAVTPVHRLPHQPAGWFAMTYGRTHPLCHCEER